MLLNQGLRHQGINIVFDVYKVLIRKIIKKINKGFDDNVLMYPFEAINVASARSLGSRPCASSQLSGIPSPSKSTGACRRY